MSLVQLYTASLDLASIISETITNITKRIEAGTEQMYFHVCVIYLCFNVKIK